MVMNPLSIAFNLIRVLVFWLHPVSTKKSDYGPHFRKMAGIINELLRISTKPTSANQRRMNADPFESFLMDMGYRVRDMGGSDDPENDTDANEDNDEAMDDAGSVQQCRTS